MISIQALTEINSLSTKYPIPHPSPVLCTCPYLVNVANEIDQTCPFPNGHGTVHAGNVSLQT